MAIGRQRRILSRGPTPALAFQDDHIAAVWGLDQRWLSLQGGKPVKKPLGRVQGGDADHLSYGSGLEREGRPGFTAGMEGAVDRTWLPILTRESERMGGAESVFRFSLGRQVHGRSRRGEYIWF